MGKENVVFLVTDSYIVKNCHQSSIFRLNKAKLKHSSILLLSSDYNPVLKKII